MPLNKAPPPTSLFNEKSLELGFVNGSTVSKIGFKSSQSVAPVLPEAFPPEALFISTHCAVVVSI